MRKSLCLLAAVATLLTYADEGSVTTNSLADKVSAHERMLQRTGGMITIPGKGKVVLANAQSTISVQTLELFSKQMARVLQAVVDVQSSEFSLAEAESARRTMNANVAFFVCDNDSLPMTLVSMEERWAMVNVAKMKDGNPTVEQLERRLNRSLQRTMKAIFTSVLVDGKEARIVTKGSDMDDAGGQIMMPATVVEMLSGLPAWGITNSKTTSYKRACKQGIAPLPENEYQQKIWDEVHEIPSEPIKIKFDPSTRR